jgi:threonine/homoserine/homoserine lactone efflux protein
MTTSDILWCVRGFVVGFLISMPVIGPVGSLCIRRTLSRGRLIGLVSGVGAATSDVFYAAAVAFGATAVPLALLAHRAILTCAAGVVLLALGGVALRSRPSPIPPRLYPGRMFGAFVSAMFLELSNPATIVLFAAIFTGIGLLRQSSAIHAAFLTLGTFLGCIFWWFTLTTIIDYIRVRLTPSVLRSANILFGVLLLAFGISAIISGTILLLE